MKLRLRMNVFLFVIGLILFQSCISEPHLRPASIAHPPDVILLTHDPLFQSISWNKHPTWSPDGRELAFDRDVLFKDEHGLCVIQADGTSPAMLWSIGSAAQPAWSPLGDWIACRVFSADERALMLLNRDGQRSQHVSDECYAPSWAPDGQLLACVRYSSTNDRDICLVDWHGTDLQILLAGPTDDGDPAWSPNGQHIAFTSNRDGAYNIYVVNVDDMQITQITHATGDPRRGMIQPAWSPDGTQIAFVCTSGLPFLSEGRLYVVSATGGEPKLLLDADRCYDPAWSPDGAWLAFSYGGRDQSDRVGSDIHLLRMRH